MTPGQPKPGCKIPRDSLFSLRRADQSRDQMDRLPHRFDLLRMCVGDGDVKLVLEVHQQFYLVERVGPQVVLEGGAQRDLIPVARPVFR